MQDYTPNTPNTPTKRCTRCGENFPATAVYFQRDKYRQDGFRGFCKQCGKAPSPAPFPVVFKRCTKCGETKPVTEFGIYSRNHSGLKPRCKPCMAAYDRHYKAKFKKIKPIAPDGYKRCCRCGKDFPLTAEYFYRQTEQSDGFVGSCKTCRGKQPIPVIAEGHKHCPSCGKDKPATTEYFFKNKTTKSGFASNCKVCRAEYILKNPQPVRKYPEKVAIYREANREKHAAYQRQWYANNKKYAGEYQKEWHKKNKAAARVQENRRRVLKLNSEGSHTAADVDRQYKAQKSRCYYCGCKLGKKYHVDHIVPLSRGGSNARDNLVVACPSCNCSKSDKLPSEWAQGGRLL